MNAAAGFAVGLFAVSLAVMVVGFSAATPYLPNAAATAAASDRAYQATAVAGQQARATREAVPTPQTAAAVGIAAARPTPIPADASGFTPAERAYGAYMVPRLDVIGSALSSMQQLSVQAGDQPGLIRDDRWRGLVVLSLASMRAAGAEIQRYDPIPPRFAALDETMVDLGKELIHTADEYAAGIDDLDGARIQNATRSLARAKALMEQGTEQIKAVQRA